MVYPINPSARSICGVPAFPRSCRYPSGSTGDHRGTTTDVPDVLEEAGALGVRATIVITAGFGETGRSGVQVEAELLATADGTDADRRPELPGVVNTDPRSA